MLTRPDVGTLEHIRLWLASKPAGEGYEWLSEECAWGQYCMEHYGVAQGEPTAELQLLNRKARETPHTWGALYERMS
jgi:hypothetical protein